MSYFSGHAIQRKLDLISQSKISKFITLGMTGIAAGFYSAAFLHACKSTVRAFATADIVCYDLNKCMAIIPNIRPDQLVAQHPTCSAALFDLSLQCAVLAATAIQTKDFVQITKAALDRLRSQSRRVNPVENR